ncbi:retropepsin-like aspartic protease [Mangrovimonas sp. TPBH4]|uniref:retropepsin-like aspartic protease n=1 Tax=Mangrovimonas sp. TPBH4 TaxID=1645914 RepID=UPI0006B5DAC9|nr:retropepsin-like aspartic protease [Mangrovimonas sp. TPBH4]
MSTKKAQNQPKHLKSPMRYLMLFITALTVSCAQSVQKTLNDTKLTEELDSLIEVQDFFQLKKRYYSQKNNLNQENSLYYEAIILNRFNDLEASNSKIAELLNLETLHLNDTMFNRIYDTKLLNHVNLYQYKAAAATSAHILKNYRLVNDSAKIENLENELKIWTSLANIGPQEIIKSEDATIPMTKDKVGLFNIDVSISNKTYNYIFDTGANISVIKRSLVEELGLTYIESDFYVTAFTGEKVDSDLAIAKELNIGNLTFKNVVFLVLNDEDISFPQIEYFINGIIGFPVIEAMEEVRISKDNSIFTPKTAIDYKQNNFALDGLTPIIAVKYQNDTLSFGFDTGAKSTSLYAPFYRKYKEEIELHYTAQTFTSGSAGGIIEFEGYVMDSIPLSIGNSKTTLSSLQLHKNDIEADVDHFYGNLGQDFIKQFDEMIISFKYSSVIFK